MTSEMRLSGDKVKKIKYPPLERKWYRCPNCGTKLAIIDNTTKCNDLYIKCRTCKEEVKVEI